MCQKLKINLTNKFVFKDSYKIKTLAVFAFIVVFSSFTYAQNFSVSGTVIDNTGIPLPGATIIEKGTSNGTTTDFDGNYNITVSSKNAILFISYIGFTDQEIPVNNLSIINIKLQTDSAQLDEVVVTGYGRIKKNEFVGATSLIKAADLIKSPITSLEQGMRGQLAGVQVTQSSGQPGAGISIRVRGVSSFAGGSEPLYVIDGVPLFNDDVRGLNGLSSLNPSDIESIEVLKDASSTSIYGSRAANGVVQITTKRGSSSNKVSINYNTYIAVQRIRNPYDVMTGEEFISYATEFINNSTLLSDNEKISNLEELSSYGNAETDWQKVVSRTGFMQGHNLSFTGGNSDNNYYISAGLTNQDGVIKDTDFKRISLRTNLKFKLSNSLRLNTQINLSQTKTNGFLSSDGTNTRNFGKSGVGSTLLAAPTALVYDEDGQLNDVSPYSFSKGNIENPVGILKALDRNRLNRARAVLSLTTNFSDNFSNVTRTSVDYVDRKEDFYSPSFLLQLGSQVAKLKTVRKLNTLLESFFEYKKSIGLLKISALAGSSLNDERRETISLEGTGFPDDILENNAIQTASTLGTPNTFISEESLVSFFSRIRLNLNKKYLISLDARTDGASVFSANNKWAVFGAFGAAWRISEEDFMQNTAFNNLKLRFSTGSTGNQAIKAYQSLLLGESVLTAQTAGSGVAVGLAPNLPNPDLTWETTTQTNIGLDIGLYKNKYRFSIDAYKKVTEDLLARVNLPPSSGFNRIIDNVGEIENLGIETQIGIDVVNSNDWQFTVNGQFSINENEVIKTKNGEDIFSTVQGNDTSRVTTIVREGESLFSLFALKFLGYDETGAPLYEDLNEDGDINGLDEQVLGTTLPDITYGFSTTLQYKNWTLDTNWQGVSGNKIQNTTLRDLSLPGIENNKIANARDFFPVRDDFNVRNSDQFFQDGSFLRMSNIKLSFDVNVDNIEFINKINVYASGQNLITITDYVGYDPEVNSFSGNDSRQGVDLGGYPTAKTFTFGLSASF